MKLADTLINFVRKHPTFHENEVPEMLCPNCWGQQEYGNHFYEAIKNNNVNIFESSPDVGWVKEYADKHLLQIQLHPKGEGFTCPTCKTFYKRADLDKHQH